MALPQGWRRDFSTNADVSGQRKIYENVITLSNSPNGSVDGGKYAVVFNAKTGARDIYTQDSIIGTRELLVSINANGTKTKGPVYSEIAGRQNGQSRISRAIDASQVNINRLINSSDTVNGLNAEEKKNILKQKAFGGSGNTTPSPSRPGSGSQDEAGGSADPTNGGNNPGAIDASLFRNNASFSSQENSYNPKGKKNWVYPENMNIEQDYMVIHCFNYKVGDVFAGSTDLKKLNTGSILNGENISARSFTDILGTVILPMPNNLSEANQTGWGEDSLSNLTAGLMAGATGAVSDVAGGNLFGAMQTTVETTKDIFGSNAGAKTQIQQQLTLAAAAAAVKKLGINVNAEAYRARVTGTVINPNLELLFNGPKLRAFQFSFKMSARSPQEAKEIRGIIKFFKKAMAPKRSGQKEDGFFLGAPDVFRIKFMHKGKPSIALPMLKTCALVNCNVNYTADGAYSAFELDGQPVSVQLDLSFAELTPIYNDNYGEEDSVGFAGGDAGIDNLDNPLFDPNEPSEQQNRSSAGQLTQEEAERQSTRPENRGRSSEQIRNDRGAQALEYQKNISTLYRATATPEEKEAARKRLAELSSR